MWLSSKAEAQDGTETDQDSLDVCNLSNFVPVNTTIFREYELKGY